MPPPRNAIDKKFQSRRDRVPRWRSVWVTGLCVVRAQFALQRSGPVARLVPMQRTHLVPRTTDDPATRRALPRNSLLARACRPARAIVTGRHRSGLVIIFAAVDATTTIHDLCDYIVIEHVNNTYTIVGIFFVFRTFELTLNVRGGVFPVRTLSTFCGVRRAPKSSRHAHRNCAWRAKALASVRFSARTVSRCRLLRRTQVYIIILFF